jgi:hypothetical protein
MWHARGLIDRGLGCVDAAGRFGWREPENLLDLPAQNGLADALLALAASDEANLIGL